MGMNEETIQCKNRGILAILLMILTAASPIIGSVQADHDSGGGSDGRIEVKIGIMGDMSGPVSYFWPAFHSAAEHGISHLNEEQDVYEFQPIYADSNCASSYAASAAQSLVDSGVTLVVGAICSGASMGANSVLSSYGIPHISPSSTSPALSNTSLHPGFFRTTPHDAMQAHSLATLTVSESSPALVHMTNDYSTHVAEAYEEAWNENGNQLCTTIDFEDQSANFSSIADEVIENYCDSVVLVSYQTEGAEVIEALSEAGFTGAIYGSDGIGYMISSDFDDASAADGVRYLRLQGDYHSQKADDFWEFCSNDDDCSSGIYTAEMYDAVSIIGEAFILSEMTNETLNDSIRYVGYQWEGASSEITFNEDGDVAGNGFSVHEYNYHETNYTLSDDFLVHLPPADFSFEPDSPLYGADVFTLLNPWSRENVDIAFMYDMSGPVSDFSAGFDASYEIAMDYLNSQQDEYWFNVVPFDSGCDGTTGQDAAQDVVDSGIGLVVGPLCSHVSMEVNSIFSAAGIPYISPTSSSPELSDSEEFEGFFRVIPSDGLDGPLLAYLLTVTDAGSGSNSPALVYDATDSFLEQTAELFEESWAGDGNPMCLDSDGDDLSFALYSSSPDYDTISEEIVSNSCDSVVIVTWGDSGIDMVESLRNYGFDEDIVSYYDMAFLEESDFDDPSDADGIIVAERSGYESVLSDHFWDACNANHECSGANAIFQAQAFDALSIVAQAHILSEEFDETLEEAIGYVGYQWEGASSEITFNGDGDVAGNGWDVCEYHYGSSGLELSCGGDPAWTHWSPPGFDFEPDSPLYGHDVFQWEIADFEMDTSVELFLEHVDVGEGTVEVSIQRNEILDPSIREEIDSDFGDGDGELSVTEGDAYSEHLIEESGLVPHWICFTWDEDGNNSVAPQDNRQQCENAGGYWNGPLGFISLDDEDGDGLPDSGPSLNGGPGGCSWTGASTPFAITTLNGVSAWCVDAILILSGFGDDGSEMAPVITWVWIGSFDVSAEGTDGNFRLNYPGDPEGSEPYSADTNICAWSGEDLWDASVTSYQGAAYDGNCFEVMSGENLGEVEATFASADSDGDSYKDPYDSFPDDANEWADSDGDGTGDNTDPDDDNDGYLDSEELDCGSDPNEADSIPSDNDSDGTCDPQDAFPEDANESVDTDGDGVGDNSDAFPEDANESVDTDGDGVGDSLDAFPEDANESVDTDGDGVGDNSDPDVDGDGVDNDLDEFPSDDSEGTDTDSDGLGDNSDPDDDNDGVEDEQDAFPLDASESVDTDGDGIGDNADTDDDGDGWSDTQEADCSNAGGSGDKGVASVTPEDLDGDGTCDAIDADDDDDGFEDGQDAFPRDSTEWEDANGDGLGDNANPPPSDGIPGFGAASALCASLLALAASRRRQG